MSDPVANAQLELACRLGLLEELVEALEDGADINCNGHSPVFFAVQHGHRELLAALVERGADISCFELEAGEVDAVVERLMAMAPTTDACGAPVAGMAELDAKMIRAFDRMIRNKGFAEPIKKGRLGEYESFCRGLGSLAAEECQAVVREFLELVKASTADGVDAASRLVEPPIASQLAQLGERYVKVSEDEAPGELLKDYLKERKKIS